MVKIKEGDIGIDGGANTGMFTVIVSILVGPSGYIVAVEQDPENLKILKRNIELNNLRNVEVLDKGLYSESGKIVRLYQNGVMSKIISKETKAQTAAFCEGTVTLDDIKVQLGITPKFLKMDIKCSKRFALLGTKKTMGTLGFFEGEIYSKEDLDLLMRFSNLFSFKEQPFESLHYVFPFLARHPLEMLRLKLYNRFRGTKRLGVILKSRPHSPEYPIIVYGERYEHHQ